MKNLCLNLKNIILLTFILNVLSFSINAHELDDLYNDMIGLPAKVLHWAAANPENTANKRFVACLSLSMLGHPLSMKWNIEAFKKLDDDTQKRVLLVLNSIMNVQGQNDYAIKKALEMREVFEKILSSEPTPSVGNYSVHDFDYILTLTPSMYIPFMGKRAIGMSLEDIRDELNELKSDHRSDLRKKQQRGEENQ